MEKKDLLLLCLSRIDEYLSRVDNKAAFWIGINTFIIGSTLLGNQLLSFSWDTCLNVITNLLCGGCLLSAFLGILFGLLSTCAFLAPGNKDSYQTLLFFGAISSYSLDYYKDRIAQINSDSEEIIIDLTRQVHLLSQALMKKFSRLKYSMIFTFISVILAVIFLLINLYK